MATEFFLIDFSINWTKCTVFSPGDIVVEVDIPGKSIDQENDIYKYEFTPEAAGNYNVNVFYAGQEIPFGPYKINVQPSQDNMQGMDHN